jgi:argininosuccinate lyase
MPNIKKVNKLWGGNFKQMPSQKIIDFTSGWDVKPKKPYDERLIPYDILVNQAHSKMLAKQGIISQNDAKKLLAGLNQIKKLYSQGKFKLDSKAEDAHTNIEMYLINKYGIKVGGRLHTARSRNDQIATDMRLYLKDMNNKFVQELLGLIKTLSVLSQKYKKIKVPGFTHHRPAMITSFGVIFGSFKQSLRRDQKRFKNWIDLYDKSPLGAAAGYGTSFNIDPQFTAKELGFAQVCKNSLDPITNRGEDATALAFNIAMMMKHLAQLSQTLILFSMPQFIYIKISDKFCTGSSIMPHKKNPDVLELIKAKAGVSYGILNSLLTINSANLIGYNRDTQWSKYLIMDLIDETLPALPIIGELLSSLRVNGKELAMACQGDNLDATLKMEQEARKTGKSLREVKMAKERTLM